MVLSLRNYQLDEILPSFGNLLPENPYQGDMLVDVAARERLSGEIISTRGEFQFEILGEQKGDVLVRHKKCGIVGVYFDNSLGVHTEWQGRGLGVALILYAYDHGKTPSSDRQFSTAGAAAMTKAMRVANREDENHFWP